MTHPPEKEPGQRRKTVIFLSIVWLAIAVCYLPFLNAPLVFDSVQLRTDEDRQVVQPIWVAVTANSRSLVDWTFALNYQFGGPQPWRYRLVNVVIHALAATTLFALVHGALSLPSASGVFRDNSIALALAAALIWAVHPLATQAVTFVVQRYESLMALFFLLTMYLVLRGSQSSRGYAWYVGAIAVCWLGMRCKPVMAMAPLVVLLFDYACIARGWRELFRRRWWVHASLFALLGIWFALTPISANANSTTGFGLQRVSSWEYLRTQPEILLHYLRLVVWPNALCLDYWWPVEGNPLMIYGLGAVILLMLVAGLVALWRWPPAGFLILAFFLVLAPTSSIVPIDDLAVEHRMYLPLAAVVVLVVLAAQKSIEALRAREVALKWVPALLLGGVVLALMARTIVRNADYTDPVRLYSKTVAVAPNNFFAHAELARHLQEAGQPEAAERHFQQSLQLQPLTITHTNYGRFLLQQRRFAEAEVEFQKSLQLFDDANRRRSREEDMPRAARYWKSSTHDGYALMLVADGRNDEAEEQYQWAVELDPQNARAWNNYGNLLARRDDFAEAIECYEHAIKAQANWMPPYLHLSLAQGRAGSDAGAVETIELALRLQPDWLPGKLRLVRLLASGSDEVRDGPRAVEIGEQVVAATGRKDPLALDTLAMAYAETGNFGQAVSHAKLAHQLALGMNNDSLAAEIQSRLERYRQEVPFREP